MVQKPVARKPQPRKQVRLGFRREAPSCNSPDRQVGVTVAQQTIEARRADMIHAGPSDLRNNFKHSLPRPHGRGYDITALRDHS